MGLLSGSQQFFVHRLSKLYLNKNMDLSTSGEDDELEVVDRDDYNFVDQMCKSNSGIDRRFLKFFKIMKKEFAFAIDSEYSEQSETKLYDQRAKEVSLNFLNDRSSFLNLSQLENPIIRECDEDSNSSSSYNIN